MTNYPHLEGLIETMAILRGADGCEWDREQTHQSLVRYLIEETYELVDAIERGDRAGIREELGDVLYQLLFHADIASVDPNDSFTIDDVAEAADQKMRRRHPHVFDNVEVSGVEEIRRNWQLLKAEEKPERSSVLDGVSRAVQGIPRAIEVLDKASRVGVSLPTQPEDSPGNERELGEVLLRIVSAAKQQNLDPDRALREALRRLEDEVRSVEREAGAKPNPSRE